MDEIDLLCRLPDQFIREVGVSMNDRPKKDRQIDRYMIRERERRVRGISVHKSGGLSQ